MEEEFYNAFASSPTTPAAIAQSMNMENETGTLQKPPKLMGIEEYYGWKDRFENWVQANHLRSWECIEKKYVRPRTDFGVTKAISELNDKERDMYKEEKMMISLLQQAQKIVRMNYPSGQQDIKMYYKGGVQDVEMSPKIQTAFSAGNSSDSVNQSPNSSSGISSYPSVNPKSSTTSFQHQSSKNGNGCVIQCNIALNLPNGQNRLEKLKKKRAAKELKKEKVEEVKIDEKVGKEEKVVEVDKAVEFKIIEVEKKCESVDQERNSEHSDRVQFAKEVFQVVDQVLDKDEEFESGNSSSSVNSPKTLVKRAYSKELWLSGTPRDNAGLKFEKSQVPIPEESVVRVSQV
ncbi:uncharacterized protein LOC118479627 [Helianthus annuus]|uniref:uncharacterized protein LOC118479627 n=1 Tax=Helianthus annuus TaxID=4232 RepID=UPI0016533769|nr:uncharacterized protein LOC118479627 [Helianthus annuus]